MDGRMKSRKSWPVAWRGVFVGLLAGGVLGLSGCAAPFSIETPSTMADVTSKSDARFDYRATTIDGVVVGVRVLDKPGGSGGESPEEAFWVEAIKKTLRQKRGYALLGEEKVKSANGVAGTLLKFGRDQGQSSFIYWLTVYRTGKNLHIVDAGGRKEHFEAALPAVQAALGSYKVEP